MKNKIKLIALIVIISSLFLLTGCTSNISEAEVKDRFVILYSDYLPRMSHTYIVYDKETKIEYLIILEHGYGGGITPLLDAEGKPLLYEGE